jgi:hypothetical protein
MKYKFKKNDTVYMIFTGKLLKGFIEKRYKNEDGENCYFVNFSSSNAGLRERHQINCKVYFIIRKAIVIRKLDV